LFTVNGGLSQWSAYTACSKSCGEGGTNPPPAHGGKACAGQTKESAKCKVKECPGMEIRLQNNFNNFNRKVATLQSLYIPVNL